MAAPDLSKMVGPLPLGAWIAVVGGGVGLMFYTRRQNANAVPTNPDQAPEDTGTTPGVGVGGSGQFVDVTPPANGTGDTNSAATNDEWGVSAITYLNARGNPAGAVNSAITKFLNEQQLNAQEYALVSMALAHFGSPPTPVLGPYGPGAILPPVVGGGTTPTAAPRWPVPKAPFFTYVIQSGDTLPTIGYHYNISAGNLYFYNAATLDRRARLTGNKVNSQRGKYIYAGTPIVIPWQLPGMKYRP